MRISNGIAHIENGFTAFGRKIKSTAQAAAFTVRCKREDFKVELLARQLHDTRTKLDALKGIDRTEVELREIELATLKDASRIRRQEMKLRREYAKRVIKGEIDLTTLMNNCLPPQA